MKKIILCSVIFIIALAYSVICHFYVANSVKETSELLNKAKESRSNSDYSASLEYADSARERWESLVKKGSYVLSDLTLIADISVSIARINSESVLGDDKRFMEECYATVVMLEKFLSDNNKMIS